MSKAFSRRELTEIASQISSPRLSTYIKAQHPRNTRRVLALYRWNAQISAAFVVPLHICEIVVRNAIAGVIEQIFGPQWYSDHGFERSLSLPLQRHLIDARRGQVLAGKVIAELKLAFWVSLLVKRYDRTLWNAHLRKQFPHLPSRLTTAEARKLLHDQFDATRVFRNRIAHHEPIFARDLTAEFKRIRRLIAWRSPIVAEWMDEIQDVTRLLRAKP